MTDKSDSAFPIDISKYYTLGLTKREVFAAIALHALTVNASTVQENYYAEKAVACADALIAALKDSPKFEEGDI
ncbi:hypothetical protein [Pseudanabaena sp. FACHB-2040]|uniref:hypothetical protein n=1 Tax=Pseudanabaena sp. FACHB-2040 TaxID=2692859 RepID=UPI00168973BA|nr:hypothetical protein [Pseudanabaena sp. FACHB-2040]MBD2259903.1 hypothetical protein [Pseudanabaena sp. FACHB-2040]